MNVVAGSLRECKCWHVDDNGNVHEEREDVDDGGKSSHDLRISNFQILESAGNSQSVEGRQC